MANALYANYAGLLLSGGVNWSTDTVKAQLVNLGLYTPDIEAHQFFSSVPVGARVGAAATLSAKALVNGSADASDLIYYSLSGLVVGALVLYKDTGVEATSPLMGIIDTATGLPFTPNGGDLNVVWDSGIYRIFRP